MIIDPRPKVGLQLSVDTSLDFNMFLFLVPFFYAADVLSIYIMTLNPRFVFQTKKCGNSDQRL